VGLGRAIAYYTTQCIPVLLPLNDTQKYDLAVEKDGKLQRVSVKTTQGLNKSKTHFEVQLKNCGGSSGKSTIRKFDNTSCDIVFVVTIEGIMYEIPSSEIKVSNSLTLTSEWDKYIVTLDWSTSAQEETLEVEVS
jgi:hypothetical protein